MLIHGASLPKSYEPDHVSSQGTYRLEIISAHLESPINEYPAEKWSLVHETKSARPYLLLSDMTDRWPTQGGVMHIYTVGRSVIAVKLKVNGQIEIFSKFNGQTTAFL